MAKDGETWTLTYDELAAVTGLKIASARRLVFRKKWPRTKGNDGLARIMVPVDELPRHNGSQHGSRPAVMVAVSSDTAGPVLPAMMADQTVGAGTAMMTNHADGELADLRERVAEQAGELRGLREALRIAEAAAAEAQRQAVDAARRAEKAEHRSDDAERAAVEAWRAAADLAQRLTAPIPLVAVQAPSAPASRRGWLSRLLGVKPAW